MTDYPTSREDLLAAVTEGVRQAFAETMQPPADNSYATVAEHGERHPFEDEGDGLCGVTIMSSSGNGGFICSENASNLIHRASR